jgi:hypothetical protein
MVVPFFKIPMVGKIESIFSNGWKKAREKFKNWISHTEDTKKTEKFAPMLRVKLPASLKLCRTGRRAGRIHPPPKMRRASGGSN